MAIYFHVEASKGRLMRNDAALLAPLAPCKRGDFFSRPPPGDKTGTWTLKMGKNTDKSQCMFSSRHRNVV